ncbi:hypothetical protein KKIDH5335_48200 (plasmid) [Vibrio fluvialis]|nr:hypothetical protein KKIDH5335_48200 [Vibrio fluvialis]
MISGYQLLSPEQQAEMDNLQERCTHQATMRFTPLDAVHLCEYERLCDRLEHEHYIEREIEAA